MAAAVADGLEGFFDNEGLEMAAGGGGEAAVGEEELEWLLNKDAFPTVETMVPAPAAVAPRTKGVRRRRRAPAWSSPPQVLLPRSPAVSAGQRRCRHCGTKATPQWREGLEGRGTLCNVCGVRYRSGRLLPEYRPANSPTFTPAQHSNRHSQVVEIRRCQESPAATS